MMTRRKIILYRFAALLCLLAAAATFATHSRGASACCLRTLGFGYGDSIYNYDFENQSVDASHVDWAASIIFYAGGSVNYVKSLLNPKYWWAGTSENFILNDTGSWVWDTDSGEKTDTPACLGASRHYRVYAPPSTDRMYNLDFNYYVFVTTHYDHHEGCDSWFDDSEGTEYDIANYVVSKVYSVRYDYAWWYNQQYGNQGNHHWSNDGYATYIHT
jgi:hypothetical protein